MKKLFAILLAVMLFASMATVVSAAENTTTLTTEEPISAISLSSTDLVLRLWRVLNLRPFLSASSALTLRSISAVP